MTSSEAGAAIGALRRAGAQRSGHVPQTRQIAAGACVAHSAVRGACKAGGARSGRPSGAPACADNCVAEAGCGDAVPPDQVGYTANLDVAFGTGCQGGEGSGTRRTRAATARENESASAVGGPIAQRLRGGAKRNRSESDDEAESESEESGESGSDEGAESESEESGESGSDDGSESGSGDEAESEPDDPVATAYDDYEYGDCGVCANRSGEGCYLCNPELDYGECEECGCDFAYRWHGGNSCFHCDERCNCPDCGSGLHDRLARLDWCETCAFAVPRQACPTAYSMCIKRDRQ